ncbi:MAG: DPP IV N-terminal domain-containing protein, partial [Bacteroidales bacterium]|nr:DPP IV N-terminal domain-containing protein [Bacteroidales bacterium]
MLNRFFKLCSMGLIAFHISFNLCAQNLHQEKIPLTQEQILGKLPDGIIKPRANFAGWHDNSNIIVRQNTPDGRVELLYNVKKGTMEKFEPNQNRSAALPASGNDEALMKQLISAIGKDTYKKTILHTFSPDSSKIAYIRGNNLYIFSFAENCETALTSDGTNVLMNGYSSWVYYEEILGRSTNYQAFWWSPDSKKIAYYKFDDSNIPMFPIYNSKGKHGYITETRYPKAGDDNPKVDVYIAYVDDMAKARQSEHIKADFNREDDQYFGIPFWNADGSRFIIPWMPREQNHLLLYSVDPANGTKSQVYEEKQDTWIDWMEDMQFTSEGFYMIRDFELWEQIYFQSFDGKVLKKITDGNNWGIRFIDVDEKGGYIYYMARKESGARYDFYKVSLKSGEITRLSEG